MSYSYDDYLAQQVELYCSPCEPKIIRVEQEYEGRDPFGNIEFSSNPIYNCEECDDTQCEYYHQFH